MNSQIDYKDGVSENNVMVILSEIEKKLKFNEKILERYLNDEEGEMMNNKNDSDLGVSTKQVNDNMKLAFASMDINKIKTMEKIKNNQHPEDFKLENLIAYSQKVADEVMENINKNNQNEKKPNAKIPSNKAGNSKSPNNQLAKKNK